MIQIAYLGMLSALCLCSITSKLKTAATNVACMLDGTIPIVHDQLWCITPSKFYFKDTTRALKAQH
jgi:hypothetical protein